ncbi:MAG: cyclopropane-fatty-acyl-phospholipid synthase [Gemmatimonadetes bacterium]|nr:cyclopropane-fatty-acyl-phospholipid synthase [Gemmatimonadota bacterium]
MIRTAGVTLAERGWVPTALERRAIRAICAGRLRDAAATPLEAFIDALGEAPVAPVPAAPNAQHYEVPAALFQLALGRHLKYSSGYWPAGVSTLDAAEEAMLGLTCEHAGLSDGQDVLELGCGWGSLSTFMARRYPRSRITAVSNSSTQRAFIEQQGLDNLRVVTADMNVFEPGTQFDRVVSVEMFEHMRNWPELLRRVARWLRSDGQAFVHVFCHARHAYPYETDGDNDWMARHFFTGGIMPSWDLLPQLNQDLRVAERWWLDGTHYARTAEGWRRNLEGRRQAVMAVLRAHYGDDAGRWYHRWRLFFLACEELFGFAGGTEWGVAHYALTKQPREHQRGGGSARRTIDAR